MQNLLLIETVAPPLSVPLGGIIHRLVPRALNLITAPQNRQAINSSRAKLETLKAIFAELAVKYPTPKNPIIPPILHFVFVSRKSEVFPYYAKLAVLSALHHNPGWRAMFHFTYEPSGSHWNSLRPLLTLSQVPDMDYFGIAPLRHYAHKADVIRLLALLNFGGAYLDLDTLTQKSFAPLQNQSFVMGVQPALPGQPGGLCNAIMLGAPNAAFTKLWIKQFRDFRSRGTDWLWDYMSVKTPALLARKNPALVTVLKSEAFFDPLWDKVDEVLFSDPPANAPQSNFAFHLWSNTIGTRLAQIDANYLRTSNSLYAQIARPVAKAAGEI